MEKILKKYTTIPEHLYVYRNADIQLKEIIEEMQRPGYVLVARQMGKTNLLLNAKRTLENDNRLLIYVDLSNLYDDERDCYRNIINNIIELNINLFKSIESEIEKIKAKVLTPHNEYSRCLREILKVFSGDIVIILDEVDALMSVYYSDNIFSQIRSTYFSRTTFPVFERLTYVLSGVVEPTELIKDLNKSPFNIGDKIYLNDFTKDEHEDFVRKSELKITHEISNEIFEWTNGNPRLTFDICSEVENSILEGIQPSKELLQDIVKKKYLTFFDVSPIDHIRELVKTDRQIRRAISLINKNQSNNLNDAIKIKLYLHGIIDSEFDKETKIKNKIIEQSLSENWIKSIDFPSIDKDEYGLEIINSKKFKYFLDKFKDRINSSDPYRLKDLILTGRYYLLGFVGSGGASAVYLAYDLVIEEPVAVKILKPDVLARNDMYTKLFTNEAKTTMRLQHSNIVKIFDTAIDSGMNQPIFFTVMQWLEGETLEQLLSIRKLTVKEITDIFRQTCEAVDYIHSLNILHLDIKPSNIMLEPDSNGNYKVKLLDFGLSKIILTESSTTVSLFGGTVQYCSPEHFGGEFSYQTDIYSLGATLYYMLTGNLPFSSDYVYAKMYSNMEMPPVPSINKLNPELPVALDRVIQKALSRRARERQQSAKQLFEEYEKSIKEIMSESKPQNNFLRNIKKVLEGLRNPFTK